MQTQEVAIKPTMKVTMKSDAEMLDEVMVVAYGTAKKSQFTGSASTIKARTYDYAIALRAVTTTDFMTAEVTILPTETITTAANRIVNEVKNINRVMFDYTTKPPATIEFE